MLIHTGSPITHANVQPGIKCNFTLNTIAFCKIEKFYCFCLIFYVPASYILYLSDFCRFLLCTCGWERRGERGAGEGEGASSLGRYVFGSEISYNKAPPPPAWARLLNKPKSQKIVGH